MRKGFTVILLLSMLLLGQVANAAAVPQLAQQMNITADRAVTPLDYSFFDQAAPGRLELSNVKTSGVLALK